MKSRDHTGPIQLSSAMVLGLLLVCTFAAGVWFGYALTSIKAEKPPIVRKTA